MVHLTILTPCLDVLTGTDRSISIIRLSDRAIVSVPDHDEIPLDAEFARPVIIFTAWTRTEPDIIETFQQRLRIKTPSGKVAIEKTSDIIEIAPGILGHYLLTTIKGFPAAEQGLYTIEVSVRPNADAKRWRLANFMPFLVEHNTADD